MTRIRTSSLGNSVRMSWSLSAKFVCVNLTFLM